MTDSFPPRGTILVMLLTLEWAGQGVGCCLGNGICVGFFFFQKAGSILSDQVHPLSKVVFPTRKSVGGWQGEGVLFKLVFERY